MNACELVRLETSLAAALIANWRGEANADNLDTLSAQYTEEVGKVRYADLIQVTRAVYDANRARTKVVR